MNPNDQLPVKLGSYKFINLEVVGGIIDWTSQYLTQKNCPQSLIAPLIKIVIDEVRRCCKKNPIACGYIPSDDAYEPLKLMQTVVAKTNEVCLRYLDNSKLCSLPAPGPSYNMVSSCAIKNNRRSMEDRHIIIHDLNTLFTDEEASPSSYYAIFDGHAGHDAAAYSCAHLHQFLGENKDFILNPKQALRDAFLKTDKLFLDKCEIENFSSGTTAVCALLRPKDKKLYIAWVGDSQALLVSQGKCMQCVQPHKPAREDEKNRIERAGGVVIHWGTWRVNGQLAVSRAIGDLVYKPYVTAIPDVIEIPLTGTEDFLILACDGLWDFISEKTAAHCVYDAILKNPDDIDSVSQRLVQQAKQQGSCDNISVIVVFLRETSKLAVEAPWAIRNGLNMDTLDNANSTNPCANSNPDILLKKDDFDQNLTERLENFESQTITRVFLIKDDEHQPGGFDDFGPETDVDEEDENDPDFYNDIFTTGYDLSTNIKKKETNGVVNNNTSNIFDPFCNNKEEKASFETDSELQKQQTIEFDPIKSPREETPTPPADSVHEASGGLVDNVAESGEDSEDEWNYIKGDQAQKENIPPSQTDKEICELNETNLDSDTMSQLNPNAAEFIPISPKRNTDSPAYQALVDDFVIAQSPKRIVSNNDIDINVPNPQEFESEIKSRPSNVLECANGEEEKVQHLTSQEIMENLLNGKSIDEIEFQPNSTPTKIHKATSEFHFGPNATPFLTPDKFLDRSEVSTKAVFGDESTSSYLEGKGFDASFGDEDTVQVNNKEQDPMSMSFYQDKEENDTNPFDLNKVQILPENIDDFLEKPNDADILLNDTISDLPEHDPLEPEVNDFVKDASDNTVLEHNIAIIDSVVDSHPPETKIVFSENEHEKIPTDVLVMESECKSPLPEIKSPVVDSESSFGGTQSPNLISHSPLPGDQSPLMSQSPLPMPQSPLHMSQSPLPVSHSPLPVTHSPHPDEKSPLFSQSPLPNEQLPLLREQSPLFKEQSPLPEESQVPFLVSHSPLPEELKVSLLASHSPLPGEKSPLMSQSPLPEEKSAFISQSPLTGEKSPLPVPQSPPPTERLQSPIFRQESPLPETHSPQPTSDLLIPEQELNIENVQPTTEVKSSPLTLSESPFPREEVQSPFREESTLPATQSPLPKSEYVIPKEEVITEFAQSPILKEPFLPLESIDSLPHIESTVLKSNLESPICELKSSIMTEPVSDLVLPNTESPILHTQSPIAQSPSPVPLPQSPELKSNSPLPLLSPTQSPLPYSPCILPKPQLPIFERHSPMHELDSPVEDVTSSVKDSPVIANSPVDKLTDDLIIEKVEQKFEETCSVNYAQEISNAVEDTILTDTTLLVHLDESSENMIPDSTIKSPINEQIDTESVVAADVNSFLERSSLPDVASPLSPSADESQSLERSNVDVDIHIIENVDFVTNTCMLHDLDIKSEVISRQYPEHTITSPSEESKTEEVTQNESVIAVLEESENNIAPLIAGTAVVTTAAVMQKKITSTAKPKAGSAATKKASTKPTTASPTKTTIAPKTTLKSTSTKAATTTINKVSQLRTSTSPTKTVLAPKTAPKPKCATPKSSEKKPLMNGDVKHLPAKKLPPTTSAVKSNVTAKPLPSKLSPMKSSTEGKTSTGSTRPSTAPVKTTTRPTTLPAKSTTVKTSSVTTTKSTTKTTTATSPRATTTTSKPRPATAPATARPKPLPSKPAPKAADAEKQIKETTNKQITASRSATSTKPAGSVGKPTTMTVRKSEVKGPASRSTLTKTTTVKLSSGDAKKPAELIRHISSKTKTGAVKKTKPEENGHVKEVTTTTIVTTSSIEQGELVKDISPVIENVIDNSQISETFAMTD